MVLRDEPTIQQLFDLTGKVALLTGGTGWLGPSMAAALAEQGATVIVTSRDTDRAQAVARELPSPGGAGHFGIEMDHMSEAAAEAGFARLFAHISLVLRRLQRSTDTSSAPARRPARPAKLAKSFGFARRACRPQASIINDRVSFFSYP